MAIRKLFVKTGDTVESLRKEIVADLVNDYADNASYTFGDVLGVAEKDPTKEVFNKLLSKEQERGGFTRWFQTVDTIGDAKDKIALIDLVTPFSGVVKKNEARKTLTDIDTPARGNIDTNKQYTFADVLDKKELEPNSVSFKKLSGKEYERGSFDRWFKLASAIGDKKEKQSLVNTNLPFSAKKDNFQYTFGDVLGITEKDPTKVVFNNLLKKENERGGSYRWFQTVDALTDTKNKLSLLDKKKNISNSYITPLLQTLWSTKPIKPNWKASEYVVSNNYGNSLPYDSSDVLSESERLTVIGNVREEVRKRKKTTQQWFETISDLTQTTSLVDRGKTLAKPIKKYNNSDVNERIRANGPTVPFSEQPLIGKGKTKIVGVRIYHDSFVSNRLPANQRKPEDRFLPLLTKTPPQTKIKDKIFQKTNLYNDHRVYLSGNSLVNKLSPSLENGNSNRYRLETAYNATPRLTGTRADYARLTSGVAITEQSVDGNMVDRYRVSRNRTSKYGDVSDIAKNDYIDTKKYNGKINGFDILVDKTKRTELNIRAGSRVGLSAVSDVINFSPERRNRPESRFNKNQDYKDKWLRFVGIDTIANIAIDSTVLNSIYSLSRNEATKGVDSTIRQLNGLIGNGMAFTPQFPLPGPGTVRINRPLKEYMGLDAILGQNLLKPSDYVDTNRLKLHSGESMSSYASRWSQAYLANDVKSWEKVWTNNAAGRGTIKGWVAGVKINDIEEPNDIGDKAFSFAEHDKIRLTPNRLEHGWKQNTFLNSSEYRDASRLKSAVVEYNPAINGNIGSPGDESQYFPFTFKTEGRKLNGLEQIMSLQATVSDINESYQPNWEGKSYFGRTDKIYIYSETERSIDIKFVIFAASMRELQNVYERVNWLAAQCYGEYERSSNFLKGRMAGGSILRMTIGNFFHNIPGYIRSLQYNWSHLSQSSRWELTKGLIMPQSCEVSLSYQVLSDKAPDRNSSFYGYLGEGETLEHTTGTDGGYSLNSINSRNNLIPESREGQSTYVTRLAEINNAENRAINEFFSQAAFQPGTERSP